MKLIYQRSSMTYKEILELAGKHLESLVGSQMDVVDITKPPTLEYAEHLAKTVSKLSPLVGNMIEFKVCEELNTLDWKGLGEWKRQDPGFPDTIFDGKIEPQPGIEIKTWFPLATEITARFKDSINHFDQDQTHVALVAWLPEYIIYGKPVLIDVWVGSAKSLASARDSHYHRPPDYLVFEPEDTSSRTSNLQQTNTNGYKFQGDSSLLKKAEKDILSWGANGKVYEPTVEYQTKLKGLLGKYPYRLDTNFAKMDRIQHESMEEFKSKVLESKLHGHRIKEWAKLISDSKTNTIDLIKDLI
ncbi:hypothetical protein [Wandonia haliotis]|uniref:hypothetical protein n=1 Tax=Wandonia haliotis TaxID=574963 RepID=UPI0031DCF33A